MCLPPVSDSQQQMLTRPVWVPDAMSRECMICSVKFTPFVRKHHCRRCGRVVCSSCSPHRVSLNAGEGPVTSVDTPQGKLERTCRECFKEMTAVHNRGKWLHCADLNLIVVVCTVNLIVVDCTVNLIVVVCTMNLIVVVCTVISITLYSI